MNAALPLAFSGDPQDLARRYDTVAYAAQANALSHPRHLATVATLLGLVPPPLASCRVLEVGCSDGANLLPMAATLPHATLVGCDLSHAAIAAAHATAGALGLGNVEFVARDLASLSADDGPFDYIVAHGVYSWVPPAVRDALLALMQRVLAPSGIGFVSYNVLPGCHVRRVAWDVLHRHVDGIAEPAAKLAAARAFAALMAEPGATQTEADGVLRQEFRRLATQTDSALFHDDLAVPNDPVYVEQFAAHLAQHGLAFVGEAKLSMMTAAGLAPAMQRYIATLDRLPREQYLDFARMRRFRQSLVCRTDAPAASTGIEARVGGMHVAAATAFVRAAAEGRMADGTASADAGVRATHRVLHWLVSVAPRVVPVAEAIAWQRAHAPGDAAAAKPLPALLADACYAGMVELYVEPPPLATKAGDPPCAAPLVRWQAARQRGVTNLRHEPMRIDDPVALHLLALADGTRSRADLAATLADLLPATERAHADTRLDEYLAHFALHGLLTR
ncbi:MAG: class I SAM-dependent methyltransferase [Burkholderiales bacterium]